jgi:hypothetical protein
MVPSCRCERPIALVKESISGRPVLFWILSKDAPTSCAIFAYYPVSDVRSQGELAVWTRFGLSPSSSITKVTREHDTTTLHYSPDPDNASMVSLAIEHWPYCTWDVFVENSALIRCIAAKFKVSSGDGASKKTH